MPRMVIGVNGPPQIGKGWLCGQMSKLIDVPHRIMSHKEPIAREAMDEMRWTGKYEDFKKHVFADGKTGREHMIRIGEGKRAISVHHWSKIMTESHLFRQSEVVLIDDLGFYPEQVWLMNHCDIFCTIVMAPVEYNPGMKFREDSRQCLIPLGGYRTHDSDTAFAHFKKMLADAKSLRPNSIADSVTFSFRSLLANPLVESRA